MLLKSQEISQKKKDFFKEKVILLYGENQDLTPRDTDLLHGAASGQIHGQQIPSSRASLRVLFEYHVYRVAPTDSPEDDQMLNNRARQRSRAIQD